MILQMAKENWQPGLSLTKDSRPTDFCLGLLVLILIRMILLPNANQGPQFQMLTPEAVLGLPLQLLMNTVTVSLTQ